MAPASVAFALLPLFVGAAPPLQLHLLPEGLAKERGAQCLDHTPAGYYIREQDPLKWVIWLEGGGLCIEPVDCINREHSHLGSSKFWSAESTPTAHFATSVSPLNPFANFSHVWVPYCSGDTWLGASPDGHVSLLGLQMSGHLILETLVSRLLNTTRLGSATDVIFAGTSAGGIGVYHHADWLADILAAHARALEQPPPRVVGLPVEGMFFPMNLPVMLPQFAVGNTHPLKSLLSKYLALIQVPWLPPACIEAQNRKGLSGDLCFDVSTLLPFVKTPLFIAQNRFDAMIMQDLSLCPNCAYDSKPDSLTGKFIRFNGAQMNRTVVEFNRSSPQHGWFVPNEFLHDQNFRTFFNTRVKSIAGVSFRAAIETWYWEQHPVVLVEPTCHGDGPCASLPDSAVPEALYV